MKLEDLLSISDKLFSSQQVACSLWQTLAENFYPQRADFTSTRSYSDDFADNLLDSYPVLARRDLCDGFNAMLRDGDFVEIDVQGGADYAGKGWLEDKSAKLLKLFRDHSSGFTRATKEGDHDYGTFGQCVISIEPNLKYNGLLYRNWHLRDCAWADSDSGDVEQVHRKWKPTLYELKSLFGDRMHPNHYKECSKDPMKKVEIRHVVMPALLYGKPEFEKFENVSLYVDIENKFIIEEKGINYDFYIVPRFQTIAGSPFALSPATITALPNARLLQSMTFTLVEAAERYARPPIIAQAQVTRSDVDFGPDGVTWVDKDYDERTGEALRTIRQDRGGFPIGDGMRMEVKSILGSAFYLDRLALPESNRDMTAYEVQERMKQFRRQNLPLFAPIESEYNGRLCESSFKLALSMGLMGSANDIPGSLRGKDVEWKFKSPLSQSEEEKKVQQFQLTSQLLAEAVQHDPSAGNAIDVRTALADAVEASGSPTKWRRDINEMAMLDQQQAAATAAQMAIENGVAA